MIKPILALVIALVIALAICILPLYIKGKRRRGEANTKNIEEWMNMSRSQRLKIDNKQRRGTAKRNRVLVDKIRREYRSVSSQKKNLVKDKRIT